MLINRKLLLELEPIKNMEETKKQFCGVSFGLSELGYDIRIKQNIRFEPKDKSHLPKYLRWLPYSKPAVYVDSKKIEGTFTLASAIEEFNMPTRLGGIVHDKSTWARRGLSVFNTVIEPGWKGFLTLELSFKGNQPLFITAGSGIAQVIFHKTSCDGEYNGKYQNQENKPIEARES